MPKPSYRNSSKKKQHSLDFVAPSASSLSSALSKPSDTPLMHTSQTSVTSLNEIDHSSGLSEACTPKKIPILPAIQPSFQRLDPSANLVKVYEQIYTKISSLYSATNPSHDIDTSFGDKYQKIISKKPYSPYLTALDQIPYQLPSLSPPNYINPSELYCTYNSPVGINPPYLPLNFLGNPPLPYLQISRLPETSAVSNNNLSLTNKATNFSQITQTSKSQPSKNKPKSTLSRKKINKYNHDKNQNMPRATKT
ncbi:hypothetical protein BB560_006157, partial [Smittium megazygosporum]